MDLSFLPRKICFPSCVSFNDLVIPNFPPFFSDWKLLNCIRPYSPVTSRSCYSALSDPGYLYSVHFCCLRLRSNLHRLPLGLMPPSPDLCSEFVFSSIQSRNFVTRTAFLISRYDIVPILFIYLWGQHYTKCKILRAETGQRISFCLHSQPNMVCLVLCTCVKMQSLNCTRGPISWVSVSQSFNQGTLVSYSWAGAGDISRRGAGSGVRDLTPCLLLLRIKMVDPWVHISTFILPRLGHQWEEYLWYFVEK